MDPIVQQGVEGQHGLRIVRRIARGGFAEVFEARSITGGIPCALKVSLDPIDDDNPVVQRELENLQYLKALSGHPRIVVLMDVWTIGGYLVTRWELAPDEKVRSLEDLLKHYQAEGRRGIPWEPLLRYIAETAEGIDFLNGQGIYHRDIKPGNLLLFWDHVKIADLGLAKFVGASMGSHSGAGTMGYLPPEAYRGQLTPTVDLYSLAATYLKLRTGREPFGQNAEEIVERQRNTAPILDGLSEVEAAVVRQALAPGWQDRPQHGAQVWCRQLAAALQPITITSSRPADNLSDAPKTTVSPAPEASAAASGKSIEQALFKQKPEGIPPAGQPEPFDQAVSLGLSGAMAGAILGAIAGAMVGGVVWTLGQAVLGQAGMGAVGGGLIGAAGGGILGSITGSTLRTVLSAIFAAALGAFLGSVLVGSLVAEANLLLVALLTGLVGAMVWAIVWAILGALLGSTRRESRREA